MCEALVTEEECLLKNVIRDFSDQELAPRAAVYDQSGQFPWENIEGWRR